jgi:hypothetical protein
MIKYFISLFFFGLILAPTLLYAQDYQLIFDRYNPEYSFEWSGYEVMEEYEVKLKFVEFVESKGLLKDERKAFENREEEFRFSIRAVDLNDDNLADIIYQGPYMGEGSIVYIFIQTNSGFEKVFTTQQGIVAVDWQDEKINKLYVKNWGCCADPNLTNSVYQVSYLNSVPTFNLIWQSVELRSFVTKPKQTILPIRFEIINEEYRLRANPWIDDITENRFQGITGNTIGILKSGMKGTAYAVAEDESGRVWWYVLIDKEYELDNAYINYEYHEFKPYLLGWISSRYVKEIGY